MNYVLRILSISILLCIVCGGCDDGNHGWVTILEDDFNSTTLDEAWILVEGDESQYELGDGAIKMDDIVFGDGPLFFYNKSITDYRIRILCKIYAHEIDGEIQFIIHIRSEAKDNALFADMHEDKLEIYKVVDGVYSELAWVDLVPMAADETRLVLCEYNRDNITCKVKNANGALIGAVTATDPSPLSAGKVGFEGEVEKSDDEYLYLDKFKVEAWKKLD